ncbi:Neu5Ac permease [Alloiococcus otitis]|uniref:TRAP transporter, DctM subunit n=1 Tax=Alloiococcus otitis ATCC 51267 TaxID=883081 RepID=K9E9M8_9LACT|nr:TRAP transporter large permease [Alloiococcus otitis]EKU93894.1 TRAP transporter, DctM subunit [Alloiococcus otitis ATCC 51267]SUU81698.1 Neu5Ac permease [Alloiococcus otitis]
MDSLLPALVLFVSFFILLAIGVPISIGIIASTIMTGLVLLPLEQIVFITVQRMYTGIESFSLLAVPLFILAGNIMNNGGIARRLVNFSNAFTGKIPGSLVHTNVLGNMLFGALSGSAVAASSAIGGTLSPIQKDEGYDPAFSTSVNIASASSGLLIPPSGSIIVYSAISGGVSVSALFLAGYVPGILMGIITMLIAYFYAKKRNYKVKQHISNKERLRATLDALPSLGMIVVVVGGIVSGIFTATEGAGISVLYCTILSIIYGSLNWESFKNIIIDSARTSGMVLLLISASSAMSWIMAYSGIPGAISQALLGLTNNTILIYLIMIAILLIVGTFMDITPAILIFTPIFLPIATNLGMHPVHFGIVLILAMCIGTMTPPVGSVLFVACGISKVSIEKVFKPLLPYLIGMVVLLILMTFLPELSLFLPRLAGLL